MDTNLSWGTPAILSGPAKRARIHPMCSVCFFRLRAKREIDRGCHTNALKCQANLHASSTTKYVWFEFRCVWVLTWCFLLFSLPSSPITATIAAQAPPTVYPAPPIPTEARPVPDGNL